MVTDANSARHTPDLAFDECRTDRLVIRRFGMKDASALAAYRSDPAVARYQSWDVPFSDAQARSFIHGLGAAHPDTPASGSSSPSSMQRRGCTSGMWLPVWTLKIRGWRRSA